MIVPIVETYVDCSSVFKTHGQGKCGVVVYHAGKDDAATHVEVACLMTVMFVYAGRGSQLLTCMVAYNSSLR